MEKFDVVIVGGGIGGMLNAYRLIERNPNLKILLLEKGHGLKRRVCPIIAKKVSRCIKCQPCHIMEGMGGAGAFSDGKYIISTEYGGWLADIIGNDTLIDYIEQADDILVNFGATTKRFMPSDKLKQVTLQYDLHMQQAELKHLGTDENYLTMVKLEEYLSDKITIRTKANVYDVDPTLKIVSYKNNNENIDVSGDRIIFAVGRAGAQFFIDWCHQYGVEFENNQVDIGVRVELPALVWEHFSKEIYEPKILYRTKQYGDIVRMFCFNEKGHVVTENTSGVLTVNGHAYKAKSKQSENSNFALLSTSKFTKPFNKPIEYARSVASLANQIADGSVLVQRLGDLKAGQRTNAKRLKESRVRPTLDAIPGDLSLCLPKRQLDNIIETLDKLNEIAPGTANYDTLLYGVECKYYSGRPQCEQFELIKYPDVYAIGDGAGFSRSLSQAGANGLYVADLISDKL